MSTWAKEPVSLLYLSQRVMKAMGPSLAISATADPNELQWKQITLSLKICPRSKLLGQGAGGSCSPDHTASTRSQKFGNATKYCLSNICPALLERV